MSVHGAAMETERKTGQPITREQRQHLAWYDWVIGSLSEWRKPWHPAEHIPAELAERLGK